MPVDLGALLARDINTLHMKILATIESMLNHACAGRRIRRTVEQHKADQIHAMEIGFDDQGMDALGWVRFHPVRWKWGLK